MRRFGGKVGSSDWEVGHGGRGTKEKLGGAGVGEIGDGGACGGEAEGEADGARTRTLAASRQGSVREGARRAEAKGGGAPGLGAGGGGERGSRRGRGARNRAA